MKSTLSNMKKLAVVVLPMIIAITTYAGAQTVPGSGNVRGRVTGGVITVVKKSGESVRSNDGGQNWQVLDAETAANVAQNFQRVLAKRQIAAQAVATGALVSPNPTYSTTTISYEMTQPGDVLLAVYDVHGVEVLRQSEGVRQIGANSTAFDATELSNGVYYYRIMVDGVTSISGKVVVAR
jgi:hypothetical protein